MHDSNRAVPARLPNADRHAMAFHGRPSTPTPLTAARLAAEALFVARTQTTPSQPVQVTVLRKRACLPPASAAGMATPAPNESPAEQALRAPRVFTLRSKPADTDGSAAVPPLPQRTSRRDRIGHDTRARVICYLQLPRADGVGDADAGVPQSEGVSSLLHQLARIDRTFEAIRQAQAVTWRDAAIEGEWRRVASAADALARELQSALIA